MKKKILIIGGAGYVGSAFVKFLKSKYEITSVDLNWFGYNAENDDVTNLSLDYRNLKKNFIQNFDVVIWAAGHSSVKMCEDDLTGTIANNVVNFVDFAQKVNLKTKFIYLSSYRIYDILSKENITEIHNRFNLNSYYDLSKYEMDNWINLYGRLIDFEYYGLRLGSVNGPSPNMRSDMLMNEFYFNFLEKGSFNIYNTGLNKPILGMEDLLKAIDTIIDEGDLSKRGVYNLCSFNKTTLDIAKEFSGYLGCTMNSTLEETRHFNFHLSSEKFCEKFNFEFKDDVESICNSLENMDKNYLQSDRNKNIDYRP